jgi:PAS domain S-box-containing protein
MTRTVSQAHTSARPASRLAPFQRHTLFVSLLIALLTTVLMPFAADHWPHVPAFLPGYQTATIGTYAVVAYLIYGYFRQTRIRALLFLWGGCVYTAAIMLAQFFAFPGAFVPEIRLLGGSQTPSWLWFFWHLGSTGMLFGYALCEWRRPGQLVDSAPTAFWRCAALTAAALLASVLAVTVFHDAMPVVDIAGDFSRITHTGYAPLIQVIIVVALLMLWRATGFSTPISAWLGVAMVALAFDNAITMAGGTRLSIGWYVGRLNALVSALVMLGLYMREVNRVYLNAAANADQLAQANTRLETEHAHLLNLFEQAPGFVAVLGGQNNHFQIVNAAFRRLTGERELIGKAIRDALPELEGQGYFELIDNVIASGRPHVASAMKMSLRRAADGASDDLFIDVLFQPNIGTDGRPAGVFIQGNDVTEQKRAQQEVERHHQHLESLVRERTRKLERTQAALMHTQKLEAIGKLTGGVAHDFNNVLHIINGNLDLIKMFTPANEKVHARCDSAQGAIKRGAKLSSQLLSFARKQPLQPNAVSLHTVFSDIDLLLKRALGERVEVRFDFAADVGNITVDPQQLENVILNLTLNASDAMAEGGSFVVTAQNTTSGSAATGTADIGFVRLSFSDTGTGMAEDVRARAFEPFFSTKGVGKGTGLGLSMAYGFVKQSGGQIDIDSAPGAGTTVHILLPRTAEAASTTKKVSDLTPITGGDEVVLVVDDERDIQENVAAMLSALGYRVLTASSADEAVLMLDRNGRIDVLFTDVVMPGAVSCTELAERARRQHPGIRVLFTSGYTENALIHNGRLGEGINLLSKPYSRDELAVAIGKLPSPPVAQDALAQQVAG